MKLISTKQLLERVPLSRTTLWRLERSGDFPRRRQLSPGRVAWVEAEVNEWLEKRGRLQE